MLDIDVRQQVSDKVILLVQFDILKARHLQQELVVADKAAHGSNRFSLFPILIVIQQLFALLQEEGQPLLLLAGDFFRIQDLVCTVDIRRIK